MAPKTILVYFVTWTAVGHAVEAIRETRAYSNANPGAEVHLVLNNRTPFELARNCPWITATHTVDVPPDAPHDEQVFRHIPRDWDYVVFDGRSYTEGVYEGYRTRADSYFRARIAKGDCGCASIPYERQAPLRLPLPDESIAFASEHMPADGVHVGLMPAGSGRPHWYPSLGSWSTIIEGLRERFPNVTVHLLGKLGGADGRTTSRITRADIDALLDRYPCCRDRFDISLLNQLAVAQRCSVFISPHTGFAFAVLAVGTPWLTISGGRWAEFFHVGVPFYSVLPDPVKYPAFDTEAFNRTLVEANGSERIMSMCDQRIEDDLPEILEAAEMLVQRRWTFERSLDYSVRRQAILYERFPRRFGILYIYLPKLRLRRLLAAAANRFGRRR